MASYDKDGIKLYKRYSNLRNYILSKGRDIYPKGYIEYMVGGKIRKFKLEAVLDNQYVPSLQFRRDTTFHAFFPQFHAKELVFDIETHQYLRKEHAHISTVPVGPGMIKDIFDKIGMN